MRRQFAGVRFFLLSCEIELRRSALLLVSLPTEPSPGLTGAFKWDWLNREIVVNA